MVLVILHWSFAARLFSVRPANRIVWPRLATGYMYNLKDVQYLQYISLHFVHIVCVHYVFHVLARAE